MRNKRILLVDDERDFVDCLAKRLLMRGVNCESAYNGADAIKKISTGHFDAVVLDMLLPDTNGVHVLRTIRCVSPETIVVMLTGHASASDGKESMLQGAVEYLIKPVELETLLEKLCLLLKCEPYGKILLQQNCNDTV
ncbi:MAG: response regulator [Proteobacteria bacterium]|nr:response regulator [Pseudomonadota bacterium]MBU1710151.1 response regulator [Pseudomonadota bacterium]